MREIVRNRIKCKSCGYIIESKYRNDFKSCLCGKVSVDGGHDYLRRVFQNGAEDFEELSEFRDGGKC